MAGEKKKVFRMENSAPTEAASIPPAIVQGGVQKIHVDLYLKSAGVPIWERGGKRAFAVAQGFEYGTDSDFADLFKKY